ncbi:dihydrolipoamide acetyltransferase family protein [Sorangium sp. So ce388]|uniref:dihydrolipoamide acetyltransferase family protein n=1 Tax=Sorangium sp. So ce388 TaxID=3133309 RepID=UPI003F5BED08
MAEFLMPSLGADMEAGTLVKWRRAVGDRVARDDVIAEVETEKGIVEVEVFTSGLIERLLVEPGQKVPVGTPLAVIRDEREAAASAPPPVARAAPAAPAPPPRPPAAAGAPQEAAPPPAALAQGSRVSPRARRRAQELGVDLARVQGTGPDGAVEAVDVERAAASAAQEEEAAAAATKKAAVADAIKKEAAARMRRAIAATMARSKREAPHFYLGTTIDVGAAMSWIERENAARSVAERLLPGALLLKAAALALRDAPELNARWEGDEAPPAPRVHLGVAVSLRGGGLVAPALHDADRLPLAELMAALKDLVQRARAGTLRSSEMSDPTITVTSLGERGVETVFPVIFPPQVAIVGFGKVAERPWVVEGRVVPRPLVSATLAADHRVTDGHRAAAYLASLDALLQRPEGL